MAIWRDAAILLAYVHNLGDGATAAAGTDSVDRGGPGGYASRVKRLGLVRIRVCSRCGRGGAELRGEDGERLVVPLDAVRARQLAGGGREEDVRSFTDLVLEQLAAAGVEAREVVLDVAEGRLRALFSFVRTGETDVVGCTAEEGVALALRGGLRLYATAEALAHAAVDKPKAARGPDTVH